MKISRSYGAWLGEKKITFLRNVNALSLRTYVSEFWRSMQPYSFRMVQENSVILWQSTQRNVLSVRVVGMSACRTFGVVFKSSVEGQNECGALVEWYWWGEKWGTRRETCSIFTLSTKNLTCVHLLVRVKGDEFGALVDWHWLGKCEVLEVKLSQCYFHHHKFYIDWPGIEAWSLQLHAWATTRPSIPQVSHNNVYRLNSCLTEKTIRFHYKYQPVCTELIAV
jgi:hypothetical protein